MGPSDDLARWGWRLPFLLGAALSLFGFWLRSGLAETPAFGQARRDNAMAGRTVSAASIVASIAKYPRSAVRDRRQADSG